MCLVVREKYTNKLEEVYPSIAAYIESSDYYIHVNDSRYIKINKYVENLTPEEWQRCKDNRYF